VNDTDNQWTNEEENFLIGSSVVFAAQVTVEQYGEVIELPLQGVIVNDTEHQTDDFGLSSWPALTNNTIYTFVIEQPVGFFPAWVTSVEGDFSWNGTHYIIQHNVTVTDNLQIVFTQVANEPYVSEATGNIDSLTRYYSSETRNITITMTGASTVLIETRERFTPSYYDVVGADEWFWCGLDYTFEVQSADSVTVVWR